MIYLPLDLRIVILMRKISHQWEILRLLRKKNRKKEDNFIWTEKDLTHLDLRTLECENDVQ